jgi:hypothetical protein
MGTRSNYITAAFLLVAGAASAPATAAVVSPAFTYTSGGVLSDSRAFTLGFSFSLSGAATVNGLGYNSLNLTQTQTVGLWNTAGVLLASAVVNPTDQLVSNFRWADIGALNLTAGTYILAGTFTGGVFPSSLQGVTTAPGYSYISSYQQEGSGLLFPSDSGNGYGNQGIGLVNLSLGTAAVPEPATWAMMIGGFGAVGGAMRYRRRKVSVAFA